MRTSRISRDTANAIASIASRTQRPLRQTRSSNAAIRGFALHAGDAPPVSGRETGESVVGIGADRLCDESELSSAPEDDYSHDATSLASRKRKRGAGVSGVSVKHETQELSVKEIASPEKNKGRPRKARRIPAKKQVDADGQVKIEPPPNWEEVYSLTREMRNENVAPVDTMGCESLADTQRTPRDQRLQTLIALMLSSQTKDTVTAVAIKGMQDNMPGGFNLESVLAIEPPALNAFICKVGFHNLKTKYIKQTAEILRTKWKSDIPDTIEGLTSLPGVGPKMAYLCMSAAWGRDEGIGVDVHVHRITNLWGWHKTQKPEETRAALESWLPKEKWHDINNLLVGFGQTICLPVGRKCGECKLMDRGLCPSAVISKTAKVKKERVVVKKEDPGGEAVCVEEIAVCKEDPSNARSRLQMPDIEDMGS